MRFLAVLALGLALAAPASAAGPRFGVFNLNIDLAKASRNAYGDVRIAKRPKLLAAQAPGATVVRCGSDCRFGNGWLAFAKGPGLAAGDVVSARASRVKGALWSVRVKLTGRGWSRLTALSRTADARAHRLGVPDVLVVVVDGSVAAAPFANEAARRAGVLELSGFTRAAALRVAKALG